MRSHRTDLHTHRKEATGSLRRSKHSCRRGFPPIRKHSTANSSNALSLKGSITRTTASLLLLQPITLIAERKSSGTVSLFRSERTKSTKFYTIRSESSRSGYLPPSMNISSNLAKMLTSLMSGQLLSGLLPLSYRAPGYSTKGTSILLPTHTTSSTASKSSRTC